MFNWRHFTGPTRGKPNTSNASTPAGAPGITNTSADANKEEEEKGDSTTPLLSDAKDTMKDNNKKVVEEDGLYIPPHNYLPEGFLFFITKGPFSRHDLRIDFTGIDNLLEGKSRVDARNNVTKEKSLKHDFKLG